MHVATTWVVILMRRLMTVIMIILSANIKLGIRWSESIVLVIGKWMVLLVVMVLVVVVVRMHVVVLRWRLQCKMVLLMIV